MTREVFETIHSRNVGGSCSGDGYEVKYDTGYLAWSPKSVFDEAYRPIKGLSFSIALEMVKKGKSIQRSGWNGAGLVVKAQLPDENSKMSLPYLYIEYPLTAKTTPGARCPWLASQTDIMADDWSVIE